VTILQQHQLIITGLREVEEERLRATIAQRIAMFRRVPRKEIVNFSRQIAVLAEANVPLLEALNAISEQTLNPRLSQAVRALISDIEGGMPLSDALAKHPKIFSSFYVNMVRSGEASGKLTEVFGFLADYLDREYAVVAKVRGALIYPLFVLVALAIAVLFIVVKVLPSILSLFSDIGATLPLPTRILLGTVSFTKKWWWLLVALFLAILVGFQRLVSTPDGRAWRDAQLLRLPVVGGIVRALLIARVADNLGTLIGAGIPIVRALEVTQDVVGNAVLREVLGKAVSAVQRGEALHETFRASPVFPQTVVQMVAVGERTGRLDSILEHVARFYAREVEMKTASLVALIEPALIIIVGIGVAIFVAAVLLPIYSLTSQG
jgi:type IV pilus assembly protein PilC